MGSSERSSLESETAKVLMHLLKWVYQPEKRQTNESWEKTIDNGRVRAKAVLAKRPGLKSSLDDILSKAYPIARKKASGETGLPLSTFPVECPWTFEQVMDSNFWPGAPKAEIIKMGRTKGGGSRKR